MKSHLEYLLFSAIAGLVRALPLRAVRRLAKWIARACFVALPVRKSITLRNLRQAYPDRDDAFIRRIARASYEGLVTTILELMWTPRLKDIDLETVIRFVNREVVEEAIRRGKGVVLMSGHLGNWEWLCIGAARLLGRSFTVIVHPLHNPRVDALVESYRALFGNRPVPMGAAIRDVIRTLRERGIIAALADQNAPPTSVFVPFLGKPASTFEGPAAFALRSGAPMVMGFALRGADGSYDIVLEEVPTADLSGPTPGNVAELTRRHVKALERAIRKHPELWLWQHRRWKHDPGPGATVVQDPV